METELSKYDVIEIERDRWLVLQVRIQKMEYETIVGNRFSEQESEFTYIDALRLEGGEIQSFLMKMNGDRMRFYTNEGSFFNG